MQTKRSQRISVRLNDRLMIARAGTRAPKAAARLWIEVTLEPKHQDRWAEAFDHVPDLLDIAWPHFTLPASLAWWSEQIKHRWIVRILRTDVAEILIVSLHARKRAPGRQRCPVAPPFHIVIARRDVQDTTRVGAEFFVIAKHTGTQECLGKPASGLPQALLAGQFFVGLWRTNVQFAVKW